MGIALDAITVHIALTPATANVMAATDADATAG
jgi:hypothetical protein